MNLASCPPLVNTNVVKPSDVYLSSAASPFIISAGLSIEITAWGVGTNGGDWRVIHDKCGSDLKTLARGHRKTTSM